MRSGAAALCLIVTTTAVTTWPAGTAAQTACGGAQQPKQMAELLLGRDRPGRAPVSEKAFRSFVAHEITPRFPNGLTVMDAAGQWRDPARGKTIREPSKVVQILLPGGPDDAANLDAIAGAYKRQFRQHSVGVVVWATCVQF
jgi:hypothetical protein